MKNLESSNLQKASSFEGNKQLETSIPKNKVSNNGNQKVEDPQKQVTKDSQNKKQNNENSKVQDEKNIDLDQRQISLTMINDQKRIRKVDRYRQPISQNNLRQSTNNGKKDVLSTGKVPLKITEMEYQKQQLTYQLFKLEQNLQDLNSQKQIPDRSDPDLKALELVKRMHQQRKRRQLKAKVDYEKIKKANAQRQLENRLILQEIERKRRIKKLEEESKQRQKKQQKQKRLQKKRLEGVQLFARSIVFHLIQHIFDPNSTTPLQSQTLENSSSKTFKIRQQNNLIGANKSLIDVPLIVSSRNRKTLPPVVVKLDVSNHLYPNNIFRQKIIEQQKKKRQIQRQLYEQRKKAVNMKRMHNLPLVRLQKNANSIIEKQNQEDYSVVKQVTSITVQTEENNQAQLVQSSITNRMQQATQVEQKKSQTINGEQFRGPQISEQQQQNRDQNYLQNYQKMHSSRSSDQLSQQYEMQFFKSSNPDPNYKPSLQNNHFSVKMQTKFSLENHPTQQEIIAKNQSYESEDYYDIFLQNFTDVGMQEEQYFIKLVNNFKKQNKINQQPKYSIQQPFVFDIDL